MGQQFPNFQNAPFLPGQANAQPQMPAAPGAQAGMNPLQALAQQFPGIDPRLMNKAQQQVANPDAGDALTIFPGPKEMAIGAVGGVLTASALSALMEQGKNGPFDGKIPKAAQWIDELAGVKTISNYFNDRYKKIEQDYLKEALFTSIVKDVPVNAKQDVIDRAVQKAVQDMEKRHVENALAKFPNRFDDNLRKYYQDTFLKEFKDKGLTAYKERLDKTFLERTQGLAPDSAEYKAIEAGKKARTVSTDQIFNFAQKDAKLPDSIKNFDQSISQAKAQIQYLESLPKHTKEQAQLYQRLRGVKERINGLKGHYKPSYEAQAKLTANLVSRDVGPIGRTIALAGQYLQRIFNGDTMSMGGSGKRWFNAGMLGPVFAGALIWGQSINKASKAQDGEKVKTFFHDFFGTGIANFIGWELGRKWLNSSGLIHKALGRFNTKRPFDNVIGRNMPIFGERFGKKVGDPIVKAFGANWFTKGVRGFLGTGLGGMMARLSLGGLATELVAMFVFGSAFQWIGEKFSHLIFGKPSKDSIEGKKPQLPSQGQQPGLPPGMQQPMGFNPQALQQQAGGFPNQPYNPAMAAGLGQPIARNGMNGPQQPAGQVPVVFPANQRFSLSPTQVSQNHAAGHEQLIQQQIVNQQKSDQQKTNGRNSFFNPNVLNGNGSL